MHRRRRHHSHRMNVFSKRPQERDWVSRCELTGLLDPTHEPERRRIGCYLRPRIYLLLHRPASVQRERVLPFIPERSLRRIKPRFHNRIALWKRIVVNTRHMTDDKLLNRVLRTVRVTMLRPPVRERVPEVKDRDLSEWIVQRPLTIILRINTLLP